MSHVATYSNTNCDNNESTEAIKNKKLPNNNIGKVERKIVIILGDSLLIVINEKGISKKHNVRIVAKPGATSERLLLEELDNFIKYNIRKCYHSRGHKLFDKWNKHNEKCPEKELTTKLPKVKIAFSALITRID